ncbi:hypothetical protein CHU98_g9409 [Xylaria longipes]|nr:hypothetical protein CHU98_g9409 [Xylaria longipes]
MAEVQPSNRLILCPQEQSGDIERKCYEFIVCGSTCVRNGTDGSTTPELRPAFLPNEIVLYILEYLNPPYKLRGFWQMVPYPMVIFYNPRLWASMSIFQICRATRSQAISRYGLPSPNTLPFDASVDSVSLRTDVSEYFFALNIYFGSNPKEVNALDDIYCDTVASGHNSSFFYYQVNKSSPSAQMPAKQLSYDLLLDKAQCVEIKAGDRSSLGGSAWDAIFDSLSEYKSLRQLKLKIYGHYTCGESKNQAHKIVCYEHPYWEVYVARITSEFASSLHRLETLAVFEIEKTEARCQAQEREIRRAIGLK